MSETLHVAQNNAKTLLKIQHFYVDHHWHPHVFFHGKNVFLCVSHDSETYFGRLEN